MQFVIDRFEGDIAVCESLETQEKREITRGTLPKQAKEGSVLVILEGEVRLDKQATVERSKKIKELMDSLWE